MNVPLVCLAQKEKAIGHRARQNQIKILKLNAMHHADFSTIGKLILTLSMERL
jgi:hypothetical protein